MEEELNTTTNTSILNMNIDTFIKTSKILLVLPSISNSNHPDNGIKAKILEEIKNKCDKNKIILVIATLSGNQPVINYQKDELLKIWTNNVFINKEIELIDINDINVNEYYGIFLPCFSSIYEEISDEKNKLALIVSMFHFQKKIVCCLGHSVFCLLQVTDYSGKNNNSDNITWPFIGYSMTGITIRSFIEDNLFDITNSSIEEMIVTKGGNFISIDDVGFMTNTGSEQNNYYQFKEEQNSKYRNNKEEKRDIEISLNSNIYKYASTSSNYLNDNQRYNENRNSVCIQYENIITGMGNGDFSLCLNVFFNNIVHLKRLKDNTVQ